MVIIASETSQEAQESPEPPEPPKLFPEFSQRCPIDPDLPETPQRLPRNPWKTHSCQRLRSSPREVLPETPQWLIGDLSESSQRILRAPGKPRAARAEGPPSAPLTCDASQVPSPRVQVQLNLFCSSCRKMISKASAQIVIINAHLNNFSGLTLLSYKIMRVWSVRSHVVF